jgi:hypothetical protein
MGLGAAEVEAADHGGRLGAEQRDEGQGALADPQLAAVGGRPRVSGSPETAIVAVTAFAAVPPVIEKNSKRVSL